jgi:hypothetical protein
MTLVYPNGCLPKSGVSMLTANSHMVRYNTCGSLLLKRDQVCVLRIASAALPCGLQSDTDLTCHTL